MSVYYGNNSRNVVYQDDYDSDLTVYTYGGDDTVFLNLVAEYGGFNTVYAGDGRDYVKNYFEGGNHVNLGSGDDHYVGIGFSTSSSLNDKVYAGAGNDTLEFSTYHGDYYGEGGDDVLFSVGFNNYLSGGSGNDTVSYKGQDEDEDLSGSGMIVGPFQRLCADPRNEL
jgi:serralysin